MPHARISSLDDATISRILSAAVREFAARPYHEASYNTVIRAAGLSKGRMYYYFHSKEDLYSALLSSAIRRFMAQLEPEAALDSAKAFWQQTALWLRLWLSFLAEEPDLGRFILMTFASPESASATPAAGALKGLQQWLVSTLQRGCELGAIRADLSLPTLSAVAWANWGVVVELMAKEEITAAGAHAMVLDLWQRVLA